MKKKINILFLGGAKRVSLAEHLQKAGRCRGIDVIIHSYELDKFVPIGKIGNVIKGLKWTDSNIFCDLLSVIDQYQIDIVLPFVDRAIEIAAFLREKTKAFIPISSVDMCKTMYDKVESSRWFEANGIPQPMVYKMLHEIKYPAILKPRNGSASKGIVIVNMSKEVEGLDLEKYLVQKYIPNAVEYTVDCYVSQKGIPTSIVPRIRLETTGGEVTKTITKYNQKLIDTAYNILQSGEFRGPITIQFIANNTEEQYYVMEINPRFGGGVIGSIEAGSRTLEMLLDEYEGKEIYTVTDWSENVLMTRYMKEVVYADNI